MPSGRRSARNLVVLLEPSSLQNRAPEQPWCCHREARPVGERVERLPCSRLFRPIQIGNVEKNCAHHARRTRDDVAVAGRHRLADQFVESS